MFYNVRFRRCGHEIEQSVNGCIEYHKRYQKKYCHNHSGNTDTVTQDGLCLFCKTNGNDPAPDTIPKYGDYSKIRIVERSDCLEHYDESEVVGDKEPYAWKLKPGEVLPKNVMKLADEEWPALEKKEPKATGSDLGCSPWEMVGKGYEESGDLAQDSSYVKISKPKEKLPKN